ncbi:MAG: hypothetical protein VKJ64_19540 [Leptolyngbyaceae bacterium]|nr:hypothetical protein [Leptolyngbyaceae bacterium]
MTNNPTTHGVSSTQFGSIYPDYTLPRKATGGMGGAIALSSQILPLDCDRPSHFGHLKR